ncbi:MAG: hypothetical protein J5657_00835 [Clostridiales bacterium]|nr:hypothetical protein [Clostridiales bacterium]
MTHLNSDELFVLGVGLVCLAYIITSVVLFIVDSVKAKREKRRRKVGFIVMFIFAMALAAFIIGLIALVAFIGYAIMTSM